MKILTFKKDTAFLSADWSISRLIVAAPVQSRNTNVIDKDFEVTTLIKEKKFGCWAKLKWKQKKVGMQIINRVNFISIHETTVDKWGW